MCRRKLKAIVTFLLQVFLIGWMAVMSARDLPSYSVPEAAHYLMLPASTVRYWAAGRDLYKPLIAPARESPLLLSFVNLVELHMLGAIRRKHTVSMPNVRSALDYVQGKLGVARPLANRRFQTDGVDLFVDHYGQLINASRRGQGAMKEVLGAALVRIEWDNTGFPIRLFPYTRSSRDDEPNLIVIDPAVSGGRAVIEGTRIAIEVVAERYKAGESIKSLADDYGREITEIEEAIRCELPVAA